MRSRSNLQQTKQKGKSNPKTKSKTSVWDRVEPEKEFMERKTSKTLTKKERSPKSMQTTSAEAGSSSTREPQNNNENTKMDITLVDLTNDSSSDEDERKYPPSLMDILDHFDYDTGEQALDLQIKDSTTLSVKKAKELRRKFPNLQAENNVLDCLIEPRADVTSLSSHAAAARRLMRSMVNIDDLALRKLIRKASDVHTEITKYLSEPKSQENNVNMITPPGSPRPSTSSKSYRPKNERHPLGRTGNGNSTRKLVAEKEKEATNKLVAVDGPFLDKTTAPKVTREVIVVTSGVDYIESSDEESYASPQYDDQASGSQIVGERNIEDESNETGHDTNDGDEPVLVLNSPNAENWEDDIA